MDKILLGWSMSTRWSDPPIQLLGCIIGVPVTLTASFLPLGKLIGFQAALALDASIILGMVAWFFFVYHADSPAQIDKYVEFKDPATQVRYTGKRIPITDLVELYLQDKVSFRKDIYEVLLNHRDEFVNYKLTFSTIRFLVEQLFPNDKNSTMKDLKATKKEIAEHYDRGNDWFASFLGPRMVYTSAVFNGLDESLEVAQDNKMSLICDKLMLKSDETLLDIGCGWGTLLRHAAKNYKAKAVGVTLSVEGAAYCREQAKAEGMQDKVDILCMDYREIPAEMKFDKVSSIEMAEHVGLRNFQIYLGSIYSMMKDDGFFLMQVAGLRQGLNWQDLQWGLFMSRYIFPGADASTPLNWYIQQLELAGFEVRSVETVGRHYSHTLHRWYDNFQKNRKEMEKAYGGYLCRLWDFFLAWSVVAAGQGSAACYQILVHKNTYNFPRDVFCQKKMSGVGVMK